FNPPKIGMTWYADWMAWGAHATVRRLHAECPIDLIDAHYVYPDGAAAIALGRRFAIPVSITARGTDINLFSRMRFIQPLVARALRGAAAIIAVSDALRARMLDLGIERDQIAVIRNGIDTHAFHRRPQLAARHELGLAANARIILTVCALVPLKGIDRLIDAVAILDDPCVELVIVGEGAEREALQIRINRLGLNRRVRLVGAKSQTELAIWYAASDLFCLASQREGCPNVIIEALTCGVPIVASDVGGVRELVSDERFGFLIPEDRSSAKAFATGIQAALVRTWNRDEIAAHGGSRSWTSVAQEVVDFWSARKLC
ncbi:MAG: glycosyltransferase, partial [Gammaproteobacteria bacterium]